MAPDLPKLVASPDEVGEIAAKIREAGQFALDLEFASDGRYVPELCLMQVAWSAGENRGLALLDAQAVELDPIFALIRDESIAVIAHAARQDIALLSTRFEIVATHLWDSQIAAAFLGIGEQVGYGRLVGDLLDIKVDKGPQFTDWMKRPLSDRQLRYAAADVSHLLALWPGVLEKLEEIGRLDWVAEESAAMVAEVSVRTRPEDKFKSIGGWAALRGKSLPALIELAAWREREALASNKPPSWILPDHAMIDVCRRGAKNEAALKKAKGVGPGTLRRYATEILDAIARGEKNEIPKVPGRGSSLPSDQQPLGALLNLLVAARCATETLPPKLVGSKSDCEELVRWKLAGDKNAPLPRMLAGWRRQFVGDDAISLLSGTSSLRVADGAIVVA